MDHNLLYIAIALFVAFHGTTAISSDYAYYPGVGLYRHVSDPKTWGDAFEDCEQSGGHLLIINSDEEAETFEYIAEEQPKKLPVYWVGLTDLYKNGHFYDVKGNYISKTGYENWVPDYPRADEGFNCVNMWNLSAVWGYSNGLCNFTNPYICEVSFC